MVNYNDMFYRKYCTTCDQVYDDEVGQRGEHEGHDVQMFHGDTLFLLGWGHLEAKLHSCLIRVWLSF